MGTNERRNCGEAIKENNVASGFIALFGRNDMLRGLARGGRYRAE